MKRILAVVSTVLLLLAFASVAVAGELEDKLTDAATNGQVDVVKDLLAKGADVNAKFGDMTALMWAAQNGHADVVRVLLDKADVNAKDKDGDTALILAVQFGFADVVRVLLAKGADVNAKTNYGATALSWLYDLIEHGRVILFSDDTTPLTPAEKEKYEEIVRILKAAGAK